LEPSWDVLCDSGYAPAGPRTGRCRSAASADASSWTCTPTTAAGRAPSGAPPASTARCTARPLRPAFRRGTARLRRGRPSHRRARSRHGRTRRLQARTHQRRRRRRVPPGHVPGRHGKVRGPARLDSLVLGFERPRVEPPAERPRCCVQETLTVPPEVNAKTAQKHDHPSRAHRQSSAVAPPSSAPTRR
jgi:hypothetical protein